MDYLLLFFLVFMIVDADSILLAGPVALLAGILGILSFEMPVNQQYILLPVLRGCLQFQRFSELWKNEILCLNKRNQK